jgi:hypothetical protein
VKKIIIVIVSLIAAHVEAADDFQVKVVYGEKTTEFRIHDSGKVEFVNNYGMKTSKKLKSNDLKFLRDRVAKIKGPSNKLKNCPNTYVTLRQNKSQLNGCLGTQNTTARELQKVANLLALLF